MGVSVRSSASRSASSILLDLAPRRAAHNTTAVPQRLLDARLWLVVVTAGVGAGVVGIAITALLHLVQHTAFGYTEKTFLYGVEQASDVRRVLVLLIGGLVAGLGWWLLRRATQVHTVGAAIEKPPHSLPLLSTTADAGLQVFIVGMGASLGREGAPRQVSAAVGAWVARRTRLPDGQQRLVIAVSAGAGLAAVYDVPLGGCLFAAEVLIGSLSWRLLLPAAVASGLATVVSWIGLPNEAAYDMPHLNLTGSLAVWSVLGGPLIGVLAFGFDALMSRARADAPHSWHIVPAAVIAFGALGAVAIQYPQLLGNGKGPSELALTGALGLGTAAALMVLKPLATALCLRSGVTGGLLTPSLATGALVGVTAGHLWHYVWPGTQLGAFAFVAAAAMLSVTQRAPLCAIALVFELTRTGVTLAGPVVIAVVGAVVVNAQLTRRASGLAHAAQSVPDDPGRTIAPDRSAQSSAT
jgi:H+/Cl- antiporter ClcA